MRRNTVIAEWLSVFGTYEGVTLHRSWGKNKIRVLGSVIQTGEEDGYWFK